MPSKLANGVLNLRVPSMDAAAWQVVSVPAAKPAPQTRTPDNWSETIRLAVRFPRPLIGPALPEAASPQPSTVKCVIVKAVFIVVQKGGLG
jgi:hypothetical protein